jgi:hypothetical protein
MFVARERDPPIDDGRNAEAEFEGNRRKRKTQTAPASKWQSFDSTRQDGGRCRGQVFERRILAGSETGLRCGVDRLCASESFALVEGGAEVSPLDRVSILTVSDPQCVRLLASSGIAAR